MRQPLVHLILAFLVLGSFVFLNLVGFLAPVLDIGRLAVDFLTFPLVKGFAKFKEAIYLVLEIQDLSKRNEILTKQIQELTAELAVLEKAKLENRFLREALGFKAEHLYPLVAAEIIAWDQLNVGEKVTLNRGTRHGVGLGAPVVAAGGILVGVISQVAEHTSQMELLTSSAVTINAEVAASGTSGIVRGEHGLGLTFDLVSQTEILKVGDKVLTSGLGGQFPKNLLIGEIDKIRSAESELFQKASVLPATNLRSLRFVFVIQK